jgi:uncharacterized protein with HEPN domain
MNELDEWRLRHILEAAQEAIIFAEHETRQTLENDRKLILAIAMEITIIGEAASRITDELRNAASDIPWSAIIGMRNVLVHAYFRIDLDIIWEAIQHDLPDLISKLTPLLPATDNGEGKRIHE